MNNTLFDYVTIVVMSRQSGREWFEQSFNSALERVQKAREERNAPLLKAQPRPLTFEARDLLTSLVMQLDQELTTPAEVREQRASQRKAEQFVQLLEERRKRRPKPEPSQRHPWVDATFAVTETIAAQLVMRIQNESGVVTDQFLKQWGVQALLAQDEPGFEGLATVGRWTAEERIDLLEEAERLAAAQMAGKDWRIVLGDLDSE